MLQTKKAEPFKKKKKKKTFKEIGSLSCSSCNQSLKKEKDFYVVLYEQFESARMRKEKKKKRNKWVGE